MVKKMHIMAGIIVLSQITLAIGLFLAIEAHLV